MQDIRSEKTVLKHGSNPQPKREIERREKERKKKKYKIEIKKREKEGGREEGRKENGLCRREKDIFHPLHPLVKGKLQRN